MAHLRSARVLSWVIVIGLVLAAVAAWGFYVWRSGVGVDSRSPSPLMLVDPGPTAAPGESKPPGAPAVADQAAPSPANAGAAGPAGRPGPSASVSVNAPGGFAEQGEMKLKEGAVAKETSAAQPGEKPERPPQAPVAAEPAAPKASASPDLDAGREALARGDLVAARAALSAALKHRLPAADEAFARSELGRIADAVLFSRATPKDDPWVSVHVVASGDSLNSIARQNKITEELLMSVNRIRDPNILPIGQRLKVIHGPFSAVIDKAAYRMDVYIGDVMVREFKVGLGANDGTPRGTWVVRNKLKNPEWVDPNTGRQYLSDDPENPIGDRWIGLHCVEGECAGRTGFGLHGTIDPDSIGKNSSMGCIRLMKEDVSLAYDLFVEEISRVVIK